MASPGRRRRRPSAAAGIPTFQLAAGSSNFDSELAKLNVTLAELSPRTRRPASVSAVGGASAAAARLRSGVSHRRARLGGSAGGVGMGLGPGLSPRGVDAPVPSPTAVWGGNAATPAVQPRAADAGVTQPKPALPPTAPTSSARPDTSRTHASGTGRQSATVAAVPGANPAGSPPPGGGDAASPDAVAAAGANVDMLLSRLADSQHDIPDEDLANVEAAILARERAMADAKRQLGRRKAAAKQRQVQQAAQELAAAEERINAARDRRERLVRGGRALCAAVLPRCGGGGGGSHATCGSESALRS